MKRRKVTLGLLSLLGFILLTFTQCQKERAVPRSRGYFRIDMPEKRYCRFEKAYPYSFEYPTYAVMKRDTVGAVEPYWLNMVFPQFNGIIFLSYKPVKENLHELTEDSRRFVFKHTVKAEAISQNPFHFPEKRVHGIIYELEGNTASGLQFFLTDSTKHFLRGSLYFNNRPNADSIAPVFDFIRADVFHFIETFKWEDPVSLTNNR